MSKTKNFFYLVIFDIKEVYYYFCYHLMLQQAQSPEATKTSKSVVKQEQTLVSILYGKS